MRQPQSEPPFKPLPQRELTSLSPSYPLYPLPQFQIPIPMLEVGSRVIWKCFW